MFKKRTRALLASSAVDLAHSNFELRLPVTINENPFGSSRFAFIMALV